MLCAQDETEKSKTKQIFLRLYVHCERVGGHRPDDDDDDENDDDESRWKGNGLLLAPNWSACRHLPLGIVTKTTQHCQLAKRTIIEHQFTIITVALYAVYSLYYVVIRRDNVASGRWSRLLQNMQSSCPSVYPD